MENNSQLITKLSDLPHSTTTSVLERGKIPPHDIRLEETVLGGMLISKKGVDDVIDMLLDEMFYKPSHQLVYKAIMELFRESYPIDIISVTEQLRKNNDLITVGSEYFLVHLSQVAASSAHLQYYARIIQQKYIQRRLIKISNEIIEEAYDETTDVLDLLDSAESKLYDVAQGNLKRSAESAKDLIVKARAKIQELSQRDNEFSGIPSGFTKIDQITAGWQPSDLIIVAARPAMGKTAFTLSMARNISVMHNLPVAFFSLEMSSVQLITRLISSETGLSSDILRTGKLSNEQWEILNKGISRLENAPLYIDDTSSLSIFDLRAKARRMVSQYGIKIIIIDYLQLMTANSGSKGVGNREQEISTISRNLKALAKELDVPIIALSQLSRLVEGRATAGGHKRPQLADLRESGAIEQDADIVTFLYRPEYYKIDAWDDADGTPTYKQAEFIIAKHRNGGLDNVRLQFDRGVFRNLDFEIYGNVQEEAVEVQSKMNSAPQKMELPENISFKSYDSPSTYNPDVPF